MKKGFILWLFMLAPCLYAHDPFHPVKSRSEKVSITWLELQQVNASHCYHWLQHQKGLMDPSVLYGVDATDHRLWVKATYRQLEQFQALIKRCDQQASQIFLTARIVSVSKHYSHELGLSFPALESSSTGFRELAMSLPQQKHHSPMMVGIADVDFANLLDLHLAAMEQEGQATIIASPKLMVDDGKKAAIEAGQQIPYLENAAHGATAVHFKKAVLRLQITPKQQVGGKIHLDIQLNHDQPTHLSAGPVPAIQTENLTTDVDVLEGHTVILGGIYQQQTEHVTKGIPFLSQIPLFGALFRNHLRQTDERELLIFVTPSRCR